VAAILWEKEKGKKFALAIFSVAICHDIICLRDF
jgi:hypothetical protein